MDTNMSHAMQIERIDRMRLAAEARAEELQVTLDAESERFRNCFEDMQRLLSLIEGDPNIIYHDVAELKKALRAAPMPVRESVLKGNEWHDAYDAWWHQYASEKALNPPLEP